MDKKRLLRGAVILLVLLCFLTYATAHERLKGTDTETASILSDTSGEIEEVVLQYSSSLAAEVIPTYKSFLRQIEPDTRIFIVCENAGQVKDIQTILEDWQIRNPQRIKIINAEREITVWARDRFVVKAAKDNLRKRIVVLPSLPRSEGQDRLNDKKVPEIIAKANGENIEARKSDLFFEGGNIVTSDKHLFTGYSTVIDHERDSDEEIISRLEQEFGKKVVVVGSPEESEPDEHIDMYLTPISDRVVLLGDPSLGTKILAEQRNKTVQFQEDLQSAYELLYREDQEDTDAEEILSSYTHVKKQLESMGFKVERIPIVHVDWDKVITYNNVLMETRKGKRIVYMPVYGIKELDTTARKKYESLGFEVRAVDVSKIYKHGGTLRCVTNVLSRRAVQKPEHGEGNEHSDSLQPQNQLQQLP